MISCSAATRSSSGPDGQPGPFGGHPVLCGSDAFLAGAGQLHPSAELGVVLGGGRRDDLRSVVDVALVLGQDGLLLGYRSDDLVEPAHGLRGVLHRRAVGVLLSAQVGQLLTVAASGPAATFRHPQLGLCDLLDPAGRGLPEGSHLRGRRPIRLDLLGAGGEFLLPTLGLDRGRVGAELPDQLVVRAVLIGEAPQIRFGLDGLPVQIHRLYKSGGFDGGGERGQPIREVRSGALLH